MAKHLLPNMQLIKKDITDVLLRQCWSFYLLVELFIDHKGGFILGLPWFRRRAQIAPSHGNCLCQTPNHGFVFQENC